MKKAQKRPDRKPLVIGIIVVALFLVWMFYPSPEKKQEPIPVAPAPAVPVEKNVPYTREEFGEMFLALLKEIEPARRENEYLPVFAKEKVSWALDQNRRKLLPFHLSEDQTVTATTFAAAGHLPGGQPILQFFMKTIANMALLDFKTYKSFSREFKNNMYYGVAHEVLHLQGDPAIFLPGRTQEQRVQEEMRVWATMNFEFVRPMARQNEPLVDQVFVADALLVSCRDDWQNCPAFRNFVANRS